MTINSVLSQQNKAFKSDTKEEVKVLKNNNNMDSNHLQ